MPSVKCTIVGDNGVGKTSLIHVFMGAVLGRDVPRVFGNCYPILTVDGTKISFLPTDINASPEYERLRRLTYPGTDVFLLCFSFDNRASWESVRTLWYPEIHLHRPQAPFILVGTKCDLLDDDLITETLTERSLHVSREEAAVLAAELGTTLVECTSALSRDSLTDLFEGAIRLALNQGPQRERTSLLSHLLSFLPGSS